MVPVLAYDISGPQPFMIMELMRGGSLAHELRKRTAGFPLGEALALGESLAVALADAHAKGIAHCDFKPANVLRNAQGVWVLNDFGSAATVSSRELLRAPRWAITPPYAAPEQLRGVVSQASDVYALGVVIYELLTRSTSIGSPALMALGQRYPGTRLPELLAKLTAQDLRLRPKAREVVSLLREIRRNLNRPTHPPSAGGPSLLQGLLTIGGIVLGAGLLNQSTKTWDPNSGRYRGSDGKFRGNGLFG